MTSATGGMEGQVIAGKYQLMRLLGQGGMGAVYEGRNAVTYKRCAVKLLLYAELSQNTELVKRFFREARAGSAIESDHIVEIFDSGMDALTGCPYMVMECLQGEDLEGLMKRVGALDPVAAGKMVLQASIGLAKAHEAGVVHRDIKPANLYLTQRDSGDLIVKILDFGIAKVKMEKFHETSTGLTRTGSMLGTPLYMSPEQCKGASTIDARSDVWSLGIVLWELLTGSSPFSSATALGGLMASIITEELPLIQDRAPWIPPELAEVVHRAMSRDLSKRFQNAAELRDALQAIVPGGATLVPNQLVAVPPEQRGQIAPRLIMTDDGMLRATARTGVSMSTQHGEKKRSSWGLLIVGAVVALATGVGGVWLLKGRPNVIAEEKPAPATVAPPPPQPVVTVVQDAPIVLRKFSLGVAPAGAEVSIDGTPASIADGKLTIEGPVGTTHRVKISHAGKSEQHVVAIADTGLVPERIELKGEPGPVARGPVKRGGGTASAATPAGGTPVAPAGGGKTPAKRPTGLDDGTGEFK